MTASATNPTPRKKRVRAKRASYLAGCEWIALNDEPLDLDVENVAGYISTTLLADIFKRDPRDLAEKIVAIRNPQPKEKPARVRKPRAAKPKAATKKAAPKKTTTKRAPAKPKDGTPGPKTLANVVKLDQPVEPVVETEVAPS